MNTIIEKIVKLGDHLRQVDDKTLEDMALVAMRDNRFFDKESITNAIKYWGDHLTEEKIHSWIKPYDTKHGSAEEKKVGIVCAGNIPLVGLHDLLSVILTSHKALVKLSSKDTFLMQYVINSLGLPEKIEVVPQLKGANAYIATGSGNTTRYFEYYFKGKPSLIRGNRTSLAIIPENITKEEIKSIGEDIFKYYGMGCRNVTKILIPENFVLESLAEQWEDLSSKALNNSKYKNNYDYQLSIRLINKMPFMDCGGLIVEHTDKLFSAVSVLNVGYYTNQAQVAEYVTHNRDDIQCVVGRSLDMEDFRDVGVPFGKAQSPALSDYADNIDTVKFLMELQYLSKGY
jgi:hypothetical protein